ncbi:hypothetical protein RIR_jg9168.t1 [Rhizophagus irregularis DAOM 181602=DAOM 197198]|nr:hypothetical protein RIR_jg9168.t1 [Rhizophagus irregularis DAOM 181602=DAOM 197198]
MKPDFKDASLFTKPDFKVHSFRRVVFRRTENGELRFRRVVFRRTENKKLKFVPSGGLPKNGKWRTKVCFGFLGCLLKNGKNQNSFWIYLGWVSEERKKKTNLNGLDLGSLSYMEFRRSKTRLDPISKVYFGNQFLSSI